MPGERWSGSSEEWQQLIVRLLKIRYSLGDFIEIPDKVRGDSGIEGFARDGKAFQCYAAEEPLSTAELSNRQKKKIYSDLQKFQKNAQTLEKLLLTTKINRWILVVPRWEDKEVHAYAEEQASKIRALNLPYVASDFAPAILTGEDFLLERGKLVRTGHDALKIIFTDVDPGECAVWTGQNDDLVGSIDRKLLVVCRGDKVAALRLRNQYIRHYLQGRNALEKLNSQYPDLYESAFKVKQQKEYFLTTESLIPDALPPHKLNEALKSFQVELQKALPGMSGFTVAQLVHEGIADWLMRCPLDFFPPDSNEPTGNKV